MEEKLNPAHIGAGTLSAATAIAAAMKESFPNVTVIQDPELPKETVLTDLAAPTPFVIHDIPRVTTFQPMSGKQKRRAQRAAKRKAKKR